MSNSLWPHGLQHTRLPCPSRTPELAQTRVHRVDDAIQPSYPLLSPSPPALNLCQLQDLFQWVSPFPLLDSLIHSYYSVPYIFINGCIFGGQTPFYRSSPFITNTYAILTLARISILCWIEVMRVSIHVFLPTWVEKPQLFTTEYDVSCRLVVYKLYCVTVCLSFYLDNIFNRKCII